MAAAGNRTGILSSFADLFSPDEPNMKGKLVVFDPQVFNRTKTQLKDLDANRTEWSDAYGKFKNDWAQSLPEAQNQAKQETGFLDKFYDGSFANYLTGLRSREADARRAAGDRALEYARGATDRSSMLRGEPTGTSSATRAMAFRAGKDIENDIALNGINRERGDFDYMNKAQAGFLGQRTGILDAITKRTLLPHQLNDQELLYAINALKGIQGTRLGAASPVFWREKGTAEKVGDVLDTFADSAYKGANAYASFSGMGGGGMGGGSPGGGGGGGTTSGAQSSAVAQEYYMGNPANNSAPSNGGTFNYSAPNIPSSGGYNPGSVNPYSSPAPSWFDNPNYSPGNDPSYWQKYNGTQTFG